MTTDASSNATTTSNGVAVSTVLGMVLGVLGLFVLVISYQFLPRKPKPSSSLRALATAPPKPKPLITRLRIRCTTFITRFKRRSPPTITITTDNHQPNAHRSLRAFHLTPERRRQRDDMRKKFSSTLRLDLSFERPFKDAKNPASPRKYAHPYSRMKDDEENQIALLKPGSAVISPWSPSDDFYPRTPPPKFTPSPGPMTPPPVYAPSTPLRGSFNEPVPRSPISSERTNEVVGRLPIPTSEHRSGLDDAQILIEEVQAVIEYTRDWEQHAPDPFVIGEDDDDAASDTSSDWHTVN